MKNADDNANEAVTGPVINTLVQLAGAANAYASHHFDCHVEWKPVRFAQHFVGLRVRFIDEDGDASPGANMFLSGFYKTKDRESNIVGEDVSMIKMSIGSGDHRRDYYISNDPMLLVGFLMGIPSY